MKFDINITIKHELLVDEMSITDEIKLLEKQNELMKKQNELLEENISTTISETKLLEKQNLEKQNEISTIMSKISKKEMCEVCGKEFGNLQYMYNHVRNKKDEEHKEYYKKLMESK